MACQSSRHKKWQHTSRFIFSRSQLIYISMLLWTVVVAIIS
jgi:hypothetical protein